MENGPTEGASSPPGLKHTMGDIDDAIEPARERLRGTLLGVGAANSGQPFPASIAG